MSTLDEITKEKQRVGEALARVDAQREQLVSELRELEATERVLARYTKGPQGRKTSSVKMPGKVTTAAAPARLRGRRRGPHPVGVKWPISSDPRRQSSPC
jgi:hypothetical protein